MEYVVGTRVFGDWEIVCQLGAGSFGTVYELQKNNFGITGRSALKVIRVPHSPGDYRAAINDGMDEQSVTSYFQGMVNEIVKEITVMSSLKGHPNIVGCEDYQVIPHPGEVGWDILIRMELLTSLQEYQMGHPMPEDTVRRLGMDLCSALAFCQKRALIHRDIKPENIFVSEAGAFKLGDFGVARTAEMTSGGMSKKGTESYMAPEVYLAKPYGPSVDLYSLGLVLYKLMNGGRLPFLPPAPQPISFADRENALARRMRGEPLPPPAGASSPFQSVILKACAYEPQARYRTAEEMLSALQGAAKYADPRPHAADARDEDDEGTCGIWSHAPTPPVWETKQQRPPEQPARQPEQPARQPERGSGEDNLSAAKTSSAPRSDEKPVGKWQEEIIRLHMEAEKWRNHGETGEEIRTLEKALELDPCDSATLVKLGRAYRTAGHPDRALQYYEKAVKYNPSYAQAWQNMGTVFYLQGDYTRARDYYEKAIPLYKTRDSDYAVLLANYGAALVQCGDKKNGAAKIDEAEKLGYPNAKTLRKQLGLNWLSKIF